ncbi:MAG: rhomboid family intramembrane serine protease [Candidatus Hydrogenedentes bacterium]|nr:rhomboid family intramembrane serine protease [Candidatus Hydrogenedentota bacterium]
MSRYEYHESYFSFGYSERITWAVHRLIVLNLAVFTGQLLLYIPLGASPWLGGEVASWLAFQPQTFLRGSLWQPVTYTFLHAGLLSLFFDMLWLYFFGPDVERVLGTRQFFGFYFFCGIAGAMATLLGDVSIIGATAPVMGVLVALAVINPEREILLFPFPIPLNVRAVVLIVIALNVMSAMTAGGEFVAAAFAGMAAAYAYMKLPSWLLSWRQTTVRRRPRQGNLDKVGEAVDNIFKFDDEKRRRK